MAVIITKQEREHQYYLDNIEKIKIREHKRYINNKEKRKKQAKIWAQNNPEKRKTIYQKHRDQSKKLINEYKLKKGCAICGYHKYAEALDFHHVGEKEFGIGTSVGLSLKRIREEMAKCIVLCSNCHRELHAKEKE